MARSDRESFTHFSIWFMIVAACFAAFLATYILFVEAPPPRRIVIAAGAKDGAYYRFAQQYQNLLQREGVSVEILSTKGSVENLELLQDENSEVTVAFVQTGIVDADDSESLESLGSLYREPLWIFYRGTGTIDRLTQLADWRIAVGPEGSGTRGIALLLLKANGVEIDAAATSDLGGSAAANALEHGEIDAAFFVAAFNAPYVQQLLKNPDVRLVELAHAEAYQRQFRFLSALKIHEGLLDLRQNIPSKDIMLIAPTATLVAHRSLHPALIPLLLTVATRVHHKGDLLSNMGEFPSAKLTDLPLSGDAERFFRSGPPVLQRYLPFWLASLIDRLKIMIIPLIMLMMPLLRAAPPLVRWQTRRRIYMWYRELREIDQRAINGMTHSEAQKSLQRLDGLEKQVSGVGVPLSYMQEYYNLRLHQNLVRSRVNSILQQTESEA